MIIHIVKILGLSLFLMTSVNSKLELHTDFANNYAETDIETSNNVEQDSFRNSLQNYENVVVSNVKMDTKVVSAPAVQSAPSVRSSQAYQAPSQRTVGNYVSLNNTSYPFSPLALNTSTAQRFIDNNPGSYGMWNNVNYGPYRFDIMFAHYYAAGKLVFDANIGDVITLHYTDGSTASYRVNGKTIASVDDYYSSRTALWQQVPNNFDLMIKTCYVVDVTDIIITLERI